MGEHYTRQTVSVQAFCKKCNHVTMHRVDDRRKGPCLECIAKLEQQHTDKQNTPKPAKQEDLFT